MVVVVVVVVVAVVVLVVLEVLEVLVVVVVAAGPTVTVTYWQFCFALKSTAQMRNV